MFKDIEFTLAGEAFAVKPTFELIRKLDARKPLITMLQSVAGGVSIIDVVEYVDVLLVEAGKPRDKLEILHALTTDGTTPLDALLIEIMRAAMPSLFDAKAGKAEPQQAAKPAKATAKRKGG